MSWMLMRIRQDDQGIFVSTPAYNPLLIPAKRMENCISTMDQQSPNPSLKRELGLLEVTLSGVGIILGAGVYVLIGQAAGLARQCNLARVWFISDNGTAHGLELCGAFLHVPQSRGGV